MSQQARNNPEDQPPYPQPPYPTMSDADRDEQREQAERVPDFYVIKAMLIYGGGFVSALAAAAGHADEKNLARIKSTWPEYWTTYTVPARRLWKENLQ